MLFVGVFYYRARNKTKAAINFFKNHSTTKSLPRVPTLNSVDPDISFWILASQVKVLSQPRYQGYLGAALGSHSGSSLLCIVTAHFRETLSWMVSTVGTLEEKPPSTICMSTYQQQLCFQILGQHGYQIIGPLTSRNSQVSGSQFRGEHAPWVCRQKRRGTIVFILCVSSLLLPASSTEMHCSETEAKSPQKRC